MAMQPWTESSLRFLSVEQQALVSDHALGRVAARRGLPDVRTFEVSVHRLGDRVEACIGAVWAELGIEAAQDVADRLVVRPGLHGRLITATVPDAGGDDRYEAAARVCGHDPREPAWYGAAAGGGPPRRRLAAVGDAVLEAAYSTSQYVDDPMATEALMSEERRAGDVERGAGQARARARAGARRRRPGPPVAGRRGAGAGGCGHARRRHARRVSTWRRRCWAAGSRPAP